MATAGPSGQQGGQQGASLPAAVAASLKLVEGGETLFKNAFEARKAWDQ